MFPDTRLQDGGSYAIATYKLKTSKIHMIINWLYIFHDPRKVWYYQTIRVKSTRELGTLFQDVAASEDIR